MDKVFLLSVLVLLTSCTSSQPSSQHSSQHSSQESTLSATAMVLLEQVMAQEGELVIPYKKYRLANGLTVILHQDDSDPLVHVDVTYHVGSARETLGKSGFAHFFEHMMFQGSQNVADEQHFKVITQSGGNLNGTTNSDRTNYYQTVPKNQLEKVLWLESDRMGYLLEAITEQKFELQRATVKNERGQNVDNRPYGRVEETINQMIYPRAHPYSWPVIGYMSDLDRVSLHDLKQFFTRWYGPNNAVLSIGGDIDEQQTLAWIVKYFADINPGKTVTPLAKPLVSIRKNRYYTLEDSVSLPLLYMSFPTVYAMHADEPALDVLANILGSGPTSLFYKNLVKSGIAVQAGASHPCRELACKMNFFAVPNPLQNVSLLALEQVFKQTLADFEQRGVNDDDLFKTKVSIETGTIYGLQSVAGKMSSLAFFQTFTGNANYTRKEIARYHQVSKEDVMRVYRQYLKGKGAAVLSVIPEVDDKQYRAVVQTPNYVLPDTATAVNSTTLDLPIASNRTRFDRTVMPPVGKNPAVNIPTLWQKNFANGLKVIGTKNSETPTISLMLSMEGGPLLDDVSQAGLAALTAALMSEGTTNYAKEELSNELATLGSDISIGASGRYTYIQLSSLTKNLDATLNLMLDMMFNPAFEQADFERLKNLRLQGLQQGLKDPKVLANRALKQVLYGENNRIGLPDGGTIKTVEAITLADVKQFHRRYFSPRHANLVIVGDIEQRDILPKLEYITHWQGPDYQIPDYQVFPEQVANRLYFIDFPGAAQSVLTLVRRAMPYDATADYFKASLMNYPLGGAFNSRINLNLREDKGYTYGASSGFSGGKTLGWYSINADVKQEFTVLAMQEIIKEVTDYQQQGLTAQETQFMRQAISQNDALNFETPSQKSGFLGQLLQYDLPKNYNEIQTNIIENISIEELNAIANKELRQEMQWIVVGDGQSVKPQLEQLKLDWIELKLD